MSAQEEKEKNEKDAAWLESVTALSTSIIAAFLSISSIIGGAMGDDEIIFNSRATNEWAYFQSKSIKQNLAENNLVLLKLELNRISNDTALKNSYLAQIKTTESEVKRYEKEKKEISKNAKAYQAASEKLNQKGDFFDYAEGFYQISIVLSALTLLLKRRSMWILSIILGIIGICLTIWGYFIAGESNEKDESDKKEQPKSTTYIPTHPIKLTYVQHRISFHELRPPQNVGGTIGRSDRHLSYRAAVRNIYVPDQFDGGIGQQHPNRFMGG